MKIAIFSDVHSCYSKLKTAIADMKKNKVDQFICLGDVIGYGDKPEETVELLIKNNVTTIQGNHELAMFDKEYRKKFPKVKKQPLLNNMAILTNESIRYLETTPPYLKLKNCHFIHGTPPDKIDTYIYDVNDYYFKSLFDESEEQVFFTGHTHKLQLITYKDNIVMRQRITQNCTIYLEKGQKYLLDVGSIGFSRDNYSESKYAIYDSLNKFIIIRMVRN